MSRKPSPESDSEPAGADSARSDVAARRLDSPDAGERSTFQGEGEAALDHAQDPALDFGSGTPSPAVQRAASEEIAREFPLVIRRTCLLLFDVDPEHLQAQWQIRQEDLDRAPRAFPGDASSVRPLLRLRQIDGAARGRIVEDELSKPVGAQGIEGVSRFRVADQGALFQAELGLASQNGGWLMLVRSNQVRPPRRARAPIPRPDRPDPAPRLGQTSRALEQAPRQAPGDLSATRLTGESTAPPPDLTLFAGGRGLTPVFPLASPKAGWAPNDTFARLTALMQPARFAGDSIPLPVCDLHRASARSSGPGDAGWDPDRFDAGLDDSPPRPSGSSGGAVGETGVLSFYDPYNALSSAVAFGHGGGVDMEVHAELLIRGRARPGSEVEIFSQRLRVDGEGRFSLIYPVDDPLMLSLILARPGGSGKG